MMTRRNILLLWLALIFVSLSAQTIETTVSQSFKMISHIDRTIHTFNVGDNVTLVGYKKENSSHNIAFMAENFAEIFPFARIPFNVSQKELKKLPNALSDDISNFIVHKREEIVASRYAARKKEALNGDIHIIAKDSYSFVAEEGAFGKVERGDTLYILGYESSSSDNLFALYSSNAAGIFHISLSGYYLKYKQVLNTQYLPSIDDTDVRITIKQKQNKLMQCKAEIDAKHHAVALAGDYKGYLSYLANLRTEDYKSSPFVYGDTISILGYKFKDDYHYFALASKKGAGVYRTLSNVSSVFKNTIDVSILPNVDSPEVQTAVSRYQAIADSMMAEETRQLNARAIELKQKILEDLKVFDPVIIRVTNWSTNSVGKVEVDITVTNGSPSETIKYISFQAYFTNPVGDRVRNEIGGGNMWTARGIGPIGPRPTTLENFDERWEEFRASYNFDNGSFYNSTAQYMHMSSVTIKYMSGRTLTLTGDKLKKRVIFGSDDE